MELKKKILGIRHKIFVELWICLSPSDRDRRIRTNCVMCFSFLAAGVILHIMIMIHAGGRGGGLL